MSRSTKLLQQNQHDQALEVIDEAIAEGTRRSENSWVQTLCHHGAVIARCTENLELAKHYYQQSLACKPENSRALYGLAFISREQGDPDAAKKYAARCYKALTQDDENP